MLFDAHCHLDFPVFDDDREAVIERARAAGVTRFMVPGTTRARWPRVLGLTARSDMQVSLGLHPYFIEDHGERDVEALEAALVEQPAVVGIGECGIDARFEDSLERQWALFEDQLQLAKRFRLPIIIHCVHADDAVAKRLRQLDLPAGGLIHAFGGSAQQARRFVELGYHLGLGGGVTYPRAKRLARSVESIPDDAFVLETDSPDMPLNGHQGERNEPARLTLVRDRVADIRDQPADEVARLATANANRLFGLGVT